MHPYFLSRQNEQLLLKMHFKIHDFQGQKQIWTKSVQMCCKNVFCQFQVFSLLIINISIHFNLEKEWWTFEKTKKTHPKILSVYNHFWNIVNLHQILNIDTLQIMKLISKTKLMMQIIVLPFDFSKIQNYNLKQCSPTY